MNNKSLYSRIIGWALKLLLCAVALFLILAAFLSVLNGVDDQKRLGLQDALSDLTKKPVEITTLKEFQIFPKFKIALEGIKVSDVGGKKEIAKIDYAFIEYGLKDFLFNKKAVRDFRIKNASLVSDIWGDNAWKLEDVHIEQSSTTDPAFLLVKGYHGENAFNIRAEMESTSSAYYLAAGKNIVGDYMGYGFNGVIKSLSAGLTIHQFNVWDKKDKSPMVKGSVSIIAKKESGVDCPIVQMDLKFIEGAIKRGCNENNKNIESMKDFIKILKSLDPIETP